MTTKQIELVVAYVYDYLENWADCSCSYDFGTCWYHMSDEERIAWLTQEAARKLEDTSDSNTVDNETK